ncbi:MAG: response regulator [Syntrophobacteraceae bacterium]
MSDEHAARGDSEPVILMADDDEDDCMLARDALEESKVRGALHCVGNGIELLDYLSRSFKREKDTHPLPALILLDLNMPGKTGRQALVEIKAVPAFQNIPIVVLSTSRQEKDVDFCREMGATDFITKPVLFTEWVEMMVSLAGKWRRNQP